MLVTAQSQKAAGFRLKLSQKSAANLYMRKFGIFSVTLAGSFPVCLFLMSRVFEDVAAAANVNVGWRDAVVWSAVLSFLLASTVAWFRKRDRTKAKRAHTLNCFYHRLKA